MNAKFFSPVSRYKIGSCILWGCRCASHRQIPRAASLSWRWSLSRACGAYTTVPLATLPSQSSKIGLFRLFSTMQFSTAHEIATFVGLFTVQIAPISISFHKTHLGRAHKNALFRYMWLRWTRFTPRIASLCPTTLLTLDRTQFTPNSMAGIISHSQLLDFMEM